LLSFLRDFGRASQIISDLSVGTRPSQEATLRFQLAASLIHRLLQCARSKETVGDFAVRQALTALKKAEKEYVPLTSARDPFLEGGLLSERFRLRQYCPPIPNNSLDDKRQHCELYRLLLA
jgi:hypothetical protein